MAQNGRKLWRQRAATSAEEVMAQWRKSPTIMVHDEEGGDVDSAETMGNGQQSTVVDGQNTKENAGGDGGEEKVNGKIILTIKYFIIFG
jgi:tRNA A37 threonylcarbamoyladenosine synthetase subunit TsaC/SUA5/YrdC